jgi:thiol:disulfide interchange protein DsbC
MNVRLLIPAFIALTSVACAEPYQPNAQKAKPMAAVAVAGVPLGAEALKAKVSAALNGIPIDEVTESPIAGVYQIRSGQQYGYVSADGRYLIQGDLSNLDTKEEITENNRKGARVAALQALGEENMIVFAPNGGKAKHTVTVFTDVDCGYCRKLHSEIDQYLAQGIAIRYVFFPRSGPDSPSWKEAEAVMCSADRKNALTLAKQGQAPANVTACINPIAREYQMGLDMGLRGTPMMVLEDGEKLDGYVPANALAQRINAKKG